MIQLDDVSTALSKIQAWRFEGETVGIVPTMGALHDGHVSLVRQSKKVCDRTVATIFVNPSQFGPGEDLGRYPRTLEADLNRLESAGTDAVFLPGVETIYPPGFSTSVRPPSVSLRWEGERRPGHFEGVATIVLKLFNIFPSSHAFFGQKDYQQLRVIEAMVRDLNVPIEVVGCPIVRESDGLAMSSRNRYLSSEQRVRSLRLSAALRSVHHAFIDGERGVPSLEEVLLRELREGLDGGVDEVEYATVVDAETLEPISTVDSRAVALIAARVGTTRLIDNQILSTKEANDD